MYCEHLTQAGAIDELIAAFAAWLKVKGYLVMSGQIIDSLVIAALRQSNTDAEKADPKVYAAKPQ